MKKQVCRSPMLALLAALSCTAFAAEAPQRLDKQGEHAYRLQQPLQDFYDTAFVWSDAGRAEPSLLNMDELARRLAGYDVIFFGESHRHPGIHLQQQRLLRALHARHPAMIVSLEQFERDVQPVLDGYLAGKLGENALVDDGRAWDNYRPSYRPLVQFAKERGLPVIAAEAPTWAISCIGQQGLAVLERFTPEERSWVARELDTGPGAYRDKYMKFQSGAATHGGGAAMSEAAKARAERSFAAQVARDETMAEAIAEALQKKPGAKVLHLNGNFHSAAFLGTAERLQRRLPQLKIAVIDPVEVTDPKLPSFAGAALKEGTVLQLVYPNPESFAPGEDQSAWVRKVMAKRTANACKYAPASAPAAAPKS
ncbi:ChaN family lipoprotein [Paucibacter sp. JuS9]|uniref:ChaN family lipoprotein n=1 Tax=Paucibacter sp. JuS9 TaxID=3228748 RepID=UPI0037574CFC